ncbi:hypothetical protein [Lysinibacillus sp. NPDC092081]|uniref:hypothetical protein n=1 Tax=Lysinibacillus sp. NPDC092081 TaxID=3364131 RepID=UPI0038196911
MNKRLDYSQGFSWITLKWIDVKSVKAEHVRACIRPIEERCKFEVSPDETPVNYQERRGNFGKSVGKTTIANFVRNLKAFYSQQSFEGFKEC